MPQETTQTKAAREAHARRLAADDDDCRTMYGGSLEWEA